MPASFTQYPTTSGLVRFTSYQRREERPSLKVNPEIQSQPGWSLVGECALINGNSTPGLERITFLCLSLTNSLKDWQSISTSVTWTGTAGSSRSQFTLTTRRKLPSRAPTEHLPIAGCLLPFAMLLLLFRGL